MCYGYVHLNLQRNSYSSNDFWKGSVCNQNYSSVGQGVLLDGMLTSVGLGERTFFSFPNLWTMILFGIVLLMILVIMFTL